MKQVIILIGIPGSGKSHFCSDKEASIVSADSFFMKDGEYQFDVSELSQAHNACMKEFISYVQDKKSLIIVDNTNTTIEQIAPYYSVAKAFGYSVQLRKIVCDPVIAAKRNTHNVPYSTCKRMADQINNLKIPFFWDVEKVSNE